MSMDWPVNRVLSFFLILLFATAEAGRAERKYQLGTQMDFLTGRSNMAGSGQAGVSSFELQPQKNLSPFYAVFPSLNFKTEGRDFNLDGTYAFLWEHFQTARRIAMTAHVADLKFDSRLGKKLRLKLTESYYSTPDFTMYVLSRGVLQTAEGFQYVYDPLPAKAAFRSNNSRGSLDWDVGAKSYLTFAAAYDYRHYENISQYRGILTDQTRYEGDLSYSRKTSLHHTWTLKYIAAENRFKEYGNAFTQNATVGFSHTLSPSVQVTMEAGPSYTDNSKLGRAHFGYIGSFGISKEMRSTRLSLNYSHRSGDSSGMGTISDTDNAGLGFLQAFGRRVGANVTVSAFRSRQRMGTELIYRGLQGGAQLAVLLSNRWVVAWGGSYRKTEGVANLNLDYKQVYMTLSFRAPDFWKWKK